MFRLGVRRYGLSCVSVLGLVVLLACTSSTVVAAPDPGDGAVSTDFHVLTGGYAKAADWVSSLLRPSVPAPVGYAWASANAESLDALHDAHAARRLWGD